MNLKLLVAACTILSGDSATVEVLFRSTNFLAARATYEPVFHSKGGALCAGSPITKPRSGDHRSTATCSFPEKELARVELENPKKWAIESVSVAGELWVTDDFRPAFSAETGNTKVVYLRPTIRARAVTGTRKDSDSPHDYYPVFVSVFGVICESTAVDSPKRGDDLSMLGVCPFTVGDLERIEIAEQGTDAWFVESVYVIMADGSELQWWAVNLSPPERGTWIEDGGDPEDLMGIFESLATPEPTPLPTPEPTPLPTPGPTAVPSAISTQAPPTASPTNPPDTPEPLSPAPQTDAPTALPATLAPKTQTPAPRTPVPRTPVPQTLSPDTALPTTVAPPTAAPSTQAPATRAPATFTPRTLVPPTASPPTAFPSTSAPPTSAPPTPNPETFAPLTSSPPTGAPDTTPPATRAPATGAPATGMPATQAPETPAPERVFAKEETISSVGTVATGAAALGAAGGAGAATRLVLVSGACTGNGADRRFPFPLHPTGIKVGGSEAAGAVVGNLGIMVGFTLLMRGVLEVLKRARTKFLSRVMEGADTQGLLRFPSVPLFVFTWLYQGTALGGMVLVMYPQGVGSVVGGLVTLVACVVVPVSLFRVVVRDIPSKAVYMKDSEEQRRLFTLFCGPGEWVSVGEDIHWVNRYASVTRTFLQDKAWFFVIEYGSSFALAAIGTLNTETFSGCGHVKMAMALVFMVTVMLEAVLWPHARPRDNVTDFIALGAQVAALLLMAVAFYKEYDIGDHWQHGLAEQLFIVSGGVLLVKAAMDLGTELAILVKGRRRRLQNAAWEKAKRVNEELYKEQRTAGTGSLSDSFLSLSPGLELSFLQTCPSSTKPTIRSSEAPLVLGPRSGKHTNTARSEMLDRKKDYFKI